jgi:hypothetical protein
VCHVGSVHRIRNFDAPPALGVTGDGGCIGVYAKSGLLIIDARRGTGATMVDFDGHDVALLIGVPGRSSLVALRTFHGTVEPSAYAIEAIEVPSGKVAKLRPESGPTHPTAIAVVGATVLVAPGVPPRLPGDPSTWGPEVTDFVGK